MKTVETDSTEPNTTAAANGLLAKMQDFRFILTIFFLQHIFRITGPVSRMLQSKSADLVMASTLIDNCMKKLSKMREETDLFVTLKQEAALLF